MEKEKKLLEGEETSRIKRMLEEGVMKWGEHPEELPKEQQVQWFRKTLGRTYEDIIEVLKNYSDLKPQHYDLVAIWIIGTYLHKSFNTFPYLFINAMKGSGKTRLLKLIASMAYNGELVASMRESVLFRTAQDHTLCIDEFENVNSKETSALREILNAGYKKGGKVKRMKKVKTITGEEYQVEEFELYTPICIANINGMDEVLGDRCVTLILEKSQNDRIMMILEDFDENPQIKCIKAILNDSLVYKCSFFSEKTYIKQWNLYVNSRNGYTTTFTTLNTYNTYTTQEVLKDSDTISLFNRIYETKINGRDLELMFPLLIIANFISEDLFSKLLEIAKTSTKEKRENEMVESKDVNLLDFISSQVFTYDFTSIKKLTNDFKIFLDEEGGEWLNTRWVGRALKRLDLIVDKRRVGSGMEITLNIPKAIQLIKHYKGEK